MHTSQTIDLKGNQIVLDFAQTSASSKLKHLSMSETGLVTLAGVSRASGLRSLHLTNNMMNSIPDEVYGLTDLEELYISFNEITGPISTKLGMVRTSYRTCWCLSFVRVRTMTTHPFLPMLSVPDYHFEHDMVAYKAGKVLRL